ncbi:MAG: HAMP domain-containing protein [Desulfomonile tiedjei]|uniref:HAMP domain-containing protein n=1 Tax=Desulfomonile tiedjei TaxID=2358 RepID=A0A9D6V5N9_9BACT|nr:HAMP domain-containing protein [Desulfomonile tiedjei]
MKKRSTLERQMLTYFGLIAAASLLITVEFIWAVRTAMFEAGSLTHTSAQDVTGNSIMMALGSLQNKAVLMGIVQAIVTLIVLIMFIRRITGPLKKMVEQSRAISEGDLSRTIQIRRRDELGLLGETINALTSNIQEIVAFGLSTDSSLQKPLEELRSRTADDPVCRQHLDEIEGRLSGFKSILEDFKLLPAPLAETEVDGKP